MITRIDTIILLAYFITIMAVGVFLSRKKDRSASGFFLAGRSLNAFHVGSSIISTLAGGATIFSAIGLGFIYGIDVIWFFLAGVVGILLFRACIPHIRTLAKRHKCITLAQLLEPLAGRRTAILASIITIFIFSGFIAVNFLLASQVAQSFLGIHPYIIMCLFAGIVVLYTILGGFRAVVFTDIIQMFIILAGLLSVVIVGFLLLDHQAMTRLPSDFFQPFHAGPVFIVGIFLSTILAYFGSQDVFQRIFAARSTKEARISTIFIAVIFSVFAIFFFGISIIARALLPSGIEGGAVPLLILGILPTGLIGLVLASYLAMANSTADSELVSVASSIEQDLIRRRMGQGGRKALVLAIAVLSLLIAIIFGNIIHVILSLYTWLGILGLVVIVSLYSTRISKSFLFWSLLGGFVSAIIYTLFTSDVESAMIVGLLPSALILAIGYLVARLRGEP
ncbi:MAG: sodium:solute symporter family protein [Nanoarchaeota archaeon]